MNIPAPGPAPQRQSSVGLILLGVAAVVALLIVAGSVGYHSVRDTVARATAVSDQLVDALGSHDYQRASGLFAPAIQPHASPASLEGVESLIEARDGAYVGHDAPQWFVQNINGQTSVRLTYPVHYAHGTGGALVVVVKTDGGDQVYDCRMNAP